MENVTTMLREVPLFQSISPAQLERLAAAAHLCAYPQDAAIVEQGDRIGEVQDGASLYVILEGHVRVVLEHGDTEQELARLGPGDFFGEMSLLDGEPRSATVVAEDDIQCLILSRWELLRAMRRDPGIAIQMLAVMSKRLRATQALLV